MKTKPLSKKEKEWVKAISLLLNNPPTERLGLYTIGDANLNIYDLSREKEINTIMDSQGVDMCIAVDKIKADLGFIVSKMQIHSVSG